MLTLTCRAVSQRKCDCSSRYY